MKKIFILGGVILFLFAFCSKNREGNDEDVIYSDNQSHSDSSNSDECLFEPEEELSCNPICNTGCNEDEICSFKAGNFVCMPKGEKKTGEICDNENNLCSEGVCLSTGGGEKTCHSFCIEDSDCEKGAKCDQVLIMYSKIKACGEPAKSCDFFKQDCENGSACYPTKDGLQCLKEGKGDIDEECFYTNDCKKGLLCINLPGKKASCKKGCSKDETSEQSCSKICPDDYGFLSDSDFGFCYKKEPPKKCDILQQDCEGDGEACYYTTDGFVCAPEGELGNLEKCEYANDCKKGFVCVNYLCLAVCNVDAPLCDDGEKCQNFEGDNTKAGFCVKDEGK